MNEAVAGLIILKVIEVSSHLCAYVDNLIIASDNTCIHMEHLRLLLLGLNER